MEQNAFSSQSREARNTALRAQRRAHITGYGSHMLRVHSFIISTVLSLSARGLSLHSVVPSATETAPKSLTNTGVFIDL